MKSPARYCKDTTFSSQKQIKSAGTHFSRQEHEKNQCHKITIHHTAPHNIHTSINIFTQQNYYQTPTASLTTHPYPET